MSGKSTPPPNEAQHSGAPICDTPAREDRHDDAHRPVLFVDIDGVISLFGFGSRDRPEGGFHWIDGIVHYIGAASGGRLARLAERYELVWASGWEEKANE